ncbi:GNAT family N-acetyltransferase [Allorhizobium sp. BGMRC 0089]|uniref:GNAT family N-acetyltransferase n=1 Tax=Allorhizobium sonneratiae TaxID=2934936 RepID=UPI0020342573|nr:GNAT family N-acetyltransferase [Allorhizobium sonneratiae]MCM2294273.1 GNAT family N-acetyltransferase [Allorhizobium sonneratiae]
MIPLETSRLILRNWKDSDRDLFREINRDPKVMEFFPFRRTPEEADRLLERVRTLIETTDFCFYAVELKETGEPVGWCGLSDASLPEIFPEGTVEIGWRLATRYWGNGYITEAAKSLFAYGFTHKGLKEIIAFAVAENRRSIAIMERIGMTHDPKADFIHPRIPDTHPHLKPHVVYRITAEAWRRSSSA